MSKIWSGGASKDSSADIDDLMVGDDVLIDQEFFDYEVLTLLAYHVQICRQNILSRSDSTRIISSLLSLLEKRIDFKKELEDVHGNVESFILKEAGDSGKNLRIFLSRNEQIHTDILLYGKTELLELAQKSIDISEQLLKKREVAEGNIPGYTHYRQGMVISLKTYFDYFASVFKEAAMDLVAVSDSIDSVPFGYGSGFGSLSDVNFQKVSELLGMKPVKRNPQYLSIRRGLDELDLVYPLLKLLVNISRISQDLIMFSGDETPFFTLPDGFVTGSSLMANKRNPDFLEILQGYTSEIVGKFHTLLGIIANKSSGYHRDFQISKKIMVEVFRKTSMILNPLPQFFSGLRVNPGAAGLIIKNSSYATANAKALFSQGVTWKDAYSEAGRKVKNGEKLDEVDPDDIITLSAEDINSVEALVKEKLATIQSHRINLVRIAKEEID